MRNYLLLLLLFIHSFAFSQIGPPYRNPKLSIDERVTDLLGRMTTEEKFWQVFMCPGDTTLMNDTSARHGIFGLQVSAGSMGDAGGQLLNYNTVENARQMVRKINLIQKFYVEKTRLGIPAIMFDEALHGLVRARATAFPQAIGLAASFDTAMMSNVAGAIADETRARGIRQILSPVINIASDVRWGRVEETYGEDPLLSAAMAVSFVRAFEQKNIITTPKHFIANVGDGGRDSYPIYYDERLLNEIYFPPFQASFSQGKSRSVMTAYNSLNGVSCSTNSWLLQQQLKKNWNFKGFVISDANAVGGDIVLHHTAMDYADAGANAINNGLDVIFQSDFRHYRLFMPAFLDGRVDTTRLNDAVARVLRAKFELGLFEEPYVNEDHLSIDSSHKLIAKKAALESFVLLKNEKHTLPLDKALQTIAVIGEDADQPRLGGYSGSGNGVVSMLTGIKQRVGANTKILYAKGTGVVDHDFEIVSSKFLSGANGQEGIDAEYFNNINLAGDPAVKKIEKEINFQWTLSLPDRAIRTDFYSARWQGKIRSPKSGRFKIGLEGNDGFRLYIDNKLVIDNWQKRTYSRLLTDFEFKQDASYDIRIEFFEPNGNAHLKLIWNAIITSRWEEEIQKAVAIAKQADVAIIAAGIHEGEFQDRGLLSLPNHQEELINAVAKTGKPVIVVLVGGSAITMSNWLNNVSAVLDAWYPGEEGGPAVAGVLFGDYNPSGRLPITFPVSEGQLPLVYNHAPTGRGDDYYDLSGLPLFPFGFGLSFTNFEYRDIKIDKTTIGKDDSTEIRFTIKNSGHVGGDEVAQLYIHHQLSSVALPVIQLKSFQRVHLNAGESKEVVIPITAEMLSIYDKNLDKVIEKGNYTFMVGASSRDIRLKATLTVQ